MKIAGAVAVIAFVILYFIVSGGPDSLPFNPYRVAHAGGGIDNKTYTNSYEALDHNIKKGFKYFELDFSFTSDNRLVCLHDWKESFEKTFGFGVEEKLTLKEFESLVADKPGFENCTIEGLSVWMSNNPSAYIVTDIKESNIAALKIMLKILPDARTRVVPQIYFPDNYSAVKKLGFEQIIWTLYRVSMPDEQVINRVKEFEGPVAITMPRNRAESTLPAALGKMNIPTYVHTINSQAAADKYMTTFGITEIYTDFLQP